MSYSLSNSFHKDNLPALGIFIVRPPDYDCMSLSKELTLVKSSFAISVSAVHNILYHPRRNFPGPLLSVTAGLIITAVSSKWSFMPIYILMLSQVLKLFPGVCRF